MMDFHSHILPRVDDGSKSLTESLKMLELLASQGVDRVIATPHFYPNHHTVESFLKKRNKAFDELKQAVTSSHPEILLGAEVKFYDGISRLKNIESLFIEGTEILLLEMPFSRWSEYTVKELINLASSGICTVVIAHIDRYIKFQSKSVIFELLRSGILFQVNADAFEKFFERNKMLKLLEQGAIHFIGTDCHNLTDRAPNMEKAYNAISKKFGKRFLEKFSYSQDQIFISNQL